MTEPITLTPRQTYQRAYYEANKARMAETKRAWREANKDRVKELNRTWFVENPDYMQAYAKANPEVSRNVYAKRLAAPGEISRGWIPKLLELQRWTCPVCLKDLRYGYHIDHIEPIARGGENIDHNLQALCPTCNMQKNDSDPIEFMQSRGFLL